MKLDLKIHGVLTCRLCFKNIRCKMFIMRMFFCDLVEFKDTLDKCYSLVWKEEIYKIYKKPKLILGSVLK